MPDGYTVAVTREGDTVVLTNTAKKSGNPDGEVNPPLKRTTGKTTDKTVNKTTDKTSGAICLLVGRVLRDRKEEKNR